MDSTNHTNQYPPGQGKTNTNISKPVSPDRGSRQPANVLPAQYNSSPAKVYNYNTKQPAQVKDNIQRAMSPGRNTRQQYMPCSQKMYSNSPLHPGHIKPSIRSTSADRNSRTASSLTPTLYSSCVSRGFQSVSRGSSSRSSSPDKSSQPPSGIPSTIYNSCISKIHPIDENGSRNSSVRSSPRSSPRSCSPERKSYTTSGTITPSTQFNSCHSALTTNNHQSSEALRPVTPPITEEQIMEQEPVHYCNDSVTSLKRLGLSKSLTAPKPSSSMRVNCLLHNKCKHNCANNLECIRDVTREDYSTPSASSSCESAERQPLRAICAVPVTSKQAISNDADLSTESRDNIKPKMLALPPIPPKTGPIPRSRPSTASNTEKYSSQNHRASLSLSCQNSSPELCDHVLPLCHLENKEPNIMVQEIDGHYLQEPTNVMLAIPETQVQVCRNDGDVEYKRAPDGKVRNIFHLSDNKDEQACLIYANTAAMPESLSDLEPTVSNRKQLIVIKRNSNPMQTSQSYCTGENTAILYDNTNQDKLVPEIKRTSHIEPAVLLYDNLAIPPNSSQSITTTQKCPNKPLSHATSYASTSASSQSGQSGQSSTCSSKSMSERSGSRLVKRAAMVSTEAQNSESQPKFRLPMKPVTVTEEVAQTQCIMTYGNNKGTTIAEGKKSDVKTIPLHPEIDVGMLGYLSAVIIEWKFLHVPIKTPLFDNLDTRIVHLTDTDTIVRINGNDFHCHLLVLGCYSKFFRSNRQNIYEFYEEDVTVLAFRIIYEWMIFSDHATLELLDRENILQVFIAAQFLKIAELEEQCWAFIDSDKVFREDSAYSLYMEARKRGVTTVMELMIQRIMNFFLTLVASQDFLDLDVEAVCIFLSSNYISVNSETEILLAGTRWLIHDWKERCEHLVPVMECVRFGLIHPRTLVDIKRNPENVELTDIMANARINEMRENGLSYSVVRQYHSNTNSEHYKWVNILELAEPEQRNWTGKFKLYITYTDFLQFLDDIRQFGFKEVIATLSSENVLDYGEFGDNNNALRLDEEMEQYKKSLNYLRSIEMQNASGPEIRAALRQIRDQDTDSVEPSEVYGYRNPTGDYPDSIQ